MLLPANFFFHRLVAISYPILPNPMNATLLDRLAGVVPEVALRANACSLIVARILSSGWLVEKPGSAGSVYAPWQLGVWGNILAVHGKDQIDP